MKFGMSFKALWCAIVLIAVSPAVAQTTNVPSAPDRAATEAIIHDYLLAHPEIIPQAIVLLEERKAAQAIAENHAAIFTSWGHAWEGNPNGNVTLVEFFDYNCGFCRASVADIKRLLTEDKQLRVVYQELPVLGSDSDAAALQSLALAQQSTNWAAFHKAVYAAGDASAESLANARKVSGLRAITPAELNAPALRNRINANLELIQALHITGTPSWVVGRKLLSGAVGYDDLKAAIAEARASTK